MFLAIVEEARGLLENDVQAPMKVTLLIDAIWCTRDCWCHRWYLCLLLNLHVDGMFFLMECRFRVQRHFLFLFFFQKFVYPI